MTPVHQRRTLPPTPSPAPPARRRYDHLAILDYIDRQRTATKGYSPSERQIAAAMYLSGRSAAHRIIESLIRKGLLRSRVPSPGWPADLTLTQAGRYTVEVWRIQHAPVPLPVEAGDYRGAA